MKERNRLTRVPLAIIKCTASPRRAFNFLVTVLSWCTLASRVDYPSISAIQTRFVPCWSCVLSSGWRHSGLKRKSNAISFVSLSSPSSDLPSLYAQRPVCCLCFSVFQNLSDISFHLAIYLRLCLSLSLSLSLFSSCADDKPSPPGTS